jgi:hypothetical protein
MLKITTTGLTILLLAFPIAGSMGQATSPSSVQTGMKAFFLADIDAFIGRRITCKEQGDRAIQDRSQASHDYLRCGEIAADEQSLRQKYRLDQDLIKALDGTWVRIVQRIPATIMDTVPPASGEKPVGR